MCLVPPECNEEVKRRKESHTLWRKRGEAYWPYSNKGRRGRHSTPFAPQILFLSAERPKRINHHNRGQQTKSNAI
jgi:hypothetical protein